MKGQELTEHLQHLDMELSKLLKSYREFKDLKKPHPSKPIIVGRHLLNIMIINILILSITYTISTTLEAMDYFAYIGGLQILLSIILYLYFVTKMGKIKQVNQGSKQKGISGMSLYELDQMRFESLQTFAKSPIPSNYIAPTSIKRMYALSKKGICQTIDECIDRVEKEMNKKKHEEEIELIQYLQTLSFH